MRKRILVLNLALIMILSLLPFGALAAEITPGAPVVYTKTAESEHETNTFTAPESGMYMIRVESPDHPGYEVYSYPATYGHMIMYVSHDGSTIGDRMGLDYQTAAFGMQQGETYDIVIKKNTDRYAVKTFGDFDDLGEWRVSAERMPEAALTLGQTEHTESRLYSMTAEQTGFYQLTIAGQWSGSVEIMDVNAKIVNDTYKEKEATYVDQFGMEAGEKLYVMVMIRRYDEDELAESETSDVLWEAVQPGGTFAPENEDLRWSLSDDGILTISGTGAIPGGWNEQKWSKNLKPYIKEVVIEEGVTSIGNLVFCDLPNLTRVTIADGMTEIGESAFSDCSSLRKVNLPDSITRIGSDAFSGCSSLQEIALPKDFTTIEEGIFNGCTALERVTIPESVTSIGDYAFSGCGLREVTIPKNVTYLGQRAFQYCSSLSSVVIQNSALQIIYWGVFVGDQGTVTDVYYAGTKTEFSTNIKDVALKNAARIHYNVMDPKEHYQTELTPPTCTEQGYTTFNCDCGYTYKGDNVDALGHDYAAVVTAPTCTEQGYTTYTCTRCDDSYADDYVSALGHDWGEWETTMPATEEADGVKIRDCTRCGETETGVVPSIVHEHDYATETVTPPTCTEQGYTTHTCKCGDSYADTYVDALGHDWGEWETTTPATETEDGVKTRTCKRCGETETGVIPSVVHQHSYTAVVTEPTCTEGGYTTYTCKCGNSYRGDYVEALGHDYKKTVKRATCTENGSETYKCSRCGASYSETLYATGHDWGDWKVTKAATATEKGVETRTCQNDSKHKETRDIPALADDIPENHRFTGCVGSPISLSLRTNRETSYSISEGKNSAIKFEQTGYSAIVMGGFGTYVYGYDFTASKPGVYIVGIKNDTDGDVIHCMFTIKPHDWGPWKVTKAASTEPGEEQRVCKNNEEHVETRVIPATEKKNPFTDVKNGDYFFDPVLWALNHDPQITDGMTETTFAPGETCTRGQVVTFLWRSMGCEEPKSTNNPFSDVKDSDYFYKAVLWAVEKGITDGTSDTTFSPNDPCTRAHVVTFLWRAENKPAAGSNNPFADVASGQYYYDAVLWAVSKEITDGTSDTTFSPNDPCTRGQIVTFLYRDMK